MLVSQCHAGALRSACRWRGHWLGRRSVVGGSYHRRRWEWRARPHPLRSRVHAYAARSAGRGYGDSPQLAGQRPQGGHGRAWGVCAPALRLRVHAYAARPAGQGCGESPDLAGRRPQWCLLQGCRRAGGRGGGACKSVRPQRVVSMAGCARRRPRQGHCRVQAAVWLGRRLGVCACPLRSRAHLVRVLWPRRVGVGWRVGFGWGFVGGCGAVGALVVGD